MQADRGIACSVTAKAGYPMNTAPLGIDRIGVPFLTGIIQTTLNEHLGMTRLLKIFVGGRSLPRFLNLKADNFLYIGARLE
jgi:amidase